MLKLFAKINGNKFAFQYDAYRPPVVRIRGDPPSPGRHHPQSDAPHLQPPPSPPVDRQTSVKTFHAANKNKRRIKDLRVNTVKGSCVDNFNTSVHP